MSRAAGSDAADYRSPAGTWEPIRKDVLEDRTLTDAECRLVMYLAAKPAGWTVYPELVAKDLKRSLRHWVSPTLRLLLARGMVTKHGGRIPGQPNSVVTYRLVRDLVVKPADLGSAGSDTTVDQPKLSDLGSAGSVVTETAELKERTDLKRELKEKTTGSRGEPKRRATRIPADFREQMLADQNAKDWFREHCPDVNGKAAMDEFIDYWKGIGGQRGCKLDWPATWRNRMRRKQEDAERYKPRQQQPGDDSWVQPVSPFRDLS